MFFAHDSILLLPGPLAVGSLEANGYGTARGVGRKGLTRGPSLAGAALLEDALVSIELAKGVEVAIMLDVVGILEAGLH